MKQVKILKIVVASPGDVQAERDAIPAIVEELNKGIADERGVRLEVYRWETDAYPDFHPEGPQGVIDPLLRIDDCDIFICIFWKRFGTPTKGALSGTAYEFDLAYRTRKKQPDRPHIMVYFNETPFAPKNEEEDRQLQLVRNFRANLPKEILSWPYADKSKFEPLVRQHLTKFIRGDYSGRTLDELLQAYRDHLTRRVSTVRIFGEVEPKPLEKVFVELTLTEEYERPTTNAQWLGMMDAELRRRRDIFARDDEDSEPGQPEKERKKEKRTLKPDELLRRRTQAVIVGAPGCGKTTLLRYLALKTLQADKRFPVFLELKSLNEKAFEAVEGNLVELLFAKAVVASLDFSAAEAERCKAFFVARLKAGEVTIFLDGLDEVAGAKFFNTLCHAVNEFMASAYRHNDLIISTRPYALQHRFEGLQEMEIAGLDPLQVEAFLQHYYGDEPAIKKLQHELRRRELSELARSPFLLNVIAHLYRQQGEIVDGRLELYRRLVQLLVTQLDREKNVERFEVKDPDGSLKRDFLKQLAYERLFADEVEKDAERLILTGEIIVAKARIYCQTHQVANPHLLAADVKATPLLREIGADAYAFSHLTLQEYLAAIALAEQPDCEKIFCRAYFNPTLAEMEVLPMALGFVSDPNSLYKVLERLSESMTFSNLRLRARGLGYARKIDESHLKLLIEKLIECIDEQNREIVTYSVVIRSSFSAADAKVLDLIVDHLAHFLLANYEKLNHSSGIDDTLLFFRFHVNTAERLENIFVSALQSANVEMRRNAVQMVRTWSNGITEALLRALRDADYIVRMNAAEALRWKAAEKKVADDLLIALRDGNRTVRMRAAEALANQGEGVVKGLLAALNDTDTGVHMAAIESLVIIGGKHALQGLLLALKQASCAVREKAVEKLGEIGGENSVKNISVALKDSISSVRLAAIKALEKIGGERAVQALLVAASDEELDVCWRAIMTLTKIGGKEVEDGLLAVLKNSNKNARLGAIDALRKIGGERAIEGLLAALKDSNNDVRWQATKVLEEIGGKQIEKGLLAHLLSGNKEVSIHAVRALSEIGENRTVEALLPALQNENHEIRRDAATVLGELGDERAVNGLMTVFVDGNDLVRRAAFDALVKIGGQQAVEKLLAALKNEDTRWPAAFALEKIGGEQVIAGLRARLQDENADMHKCMVLTLGKFGEAQVLDELFLILRESDSMKRWDVIDALIKIGGKRSVDGLLVALQDANNSVRALAAYALGRIGGEPAIDGLIAAMDDKYDMVRRNAVSALGESGHKRAQEVLLLALKDENDEVRREAARAFLKIGDLWSMDALVVALQDEYDDVRLQAVEALEKINDARAITLLLEALKDDNNFVRESAARALVKLGDKNAVEGMLVAMQDYDRGVRKYAAQALARFGDARAIDGLIEALHDEEREIRRYVIEALGKIGDVRAIKPLLASIHQWTYDEVNPSRRAIHTLLEISGENAVSELLAAFQDEDYGIRSNAAKMLERLDKTVLANGLKKALSHRDNFVRQQAARVIGYYTNDKQLLAILNQLVKKDRSKEVKTIAREAAEKYANKLRYFAS